MPVDLALRDDSKFDHILIVVMRTSIIISTLLLVTSMFKSLINLFSLSCQSSSHRYALLIAMFVESP